MKVKAVTPIERCAPVTPIEGETRRETRRLRTQYYKYAHLSNDMCSKPPKWLKGLENSYKFNGCILTPCYLRPVPLYDSGQVFDVCLLRHEGAKLTGVIVIRPLEHNSLLLHSKEWSAGVLPNGVKVVFSSVDFYTEWGHAAVPTYGGRSYAYRFYEASCKDCYHFDRYRAKRALENNPMKWRVQIISEASEFLRTPRGRETETLIDKIKQESWEARTEVSRELRTAPQSVTETRHQLRALGFVA